jgi:regulator of cell morphogenesis and NO signaling
MTIETSITVGELAAKLPQATRVLERFDIDYCCGGGQSLADACRFRAIEIQEVVNAIEESLRTQWVARNYADLGQQELVEHIVNTHHAFTRSEIERLAALLNKVVSAHATRHPELLDVQKTFGDLAQDLLPHLVKEETCLFPYVVKLESFGPQGIARPTAHFGTVQNPVRMMLFEHDLAGQLLRELRRITSEYAIPGDACASYNALYEGIQEFEADLHQHIHLENNVLFPRAIQAEADLVSATGAHRIMNFKCLEALTAEHKRM